MAKNVFRLTPRATTATRAIEEHVRKSSQEDIDAIFRYGDFRFDESEGLTIAKFTNIGLDITPSQHRDLPLYEVEASDGYVFMKKAQNTDGSTRYDVLYVDIVWDKRAEAA